MNLNVLLRKIGDALQPMSDDEKLEKTKHLAEAKEAKAHYYVELSHAEKRIANANKIIKEHKPAGFINGGLFKLTGGRIILLLLGVVIIVLAIKACSGG